ncbi:MAG: patatin-like phospholipase family protein [Proteobacteria bacterium]|nr:patatin-like phospholipase family protein [Pseudomonadota bacterium]
MPDAEIKRAIVLSGGGARGAYEAGVLRFILEDLPARLGHPPAFDLVCGTSVGAIHACYLAATAHETHGHGDRLVNIWEDLEVDEVFRFSARDVFRLPRRLLGVRRVAEQLQAGRRPDRLFGLLDTQPLEQLVLEAIPWRALRRNIRGGKIEAVCVAATQIATGRSVIFVERGDRTLPPWSDGANIRMQSIRLMPIHALASAAIPLLFPAVRVGARYYADGGLRLNTPLAPAVRLGANRVLVIGLAHGPRAQDSEALAQQRTANFGNPLFLFGKILNALLLSPVDADLARMNFVNGIIRDGEKTFGPDFLERLNETAVAAHGRELQKIHHIVIRPTTDLGILAGELLNSPPEGFELSPFLRFFARGPDTEDGPREVDLLSYLLFDRHFTTPLADLGYADAKAKEEDLLRFFANDPME